MRKLILFIIVILPLGFMASKYSPFTAIPADEEVIIFNDVPYDGKRIYIGPMQTNASRSEIRYNICNTGRQDIRLGGSYNDILIKLDPSFHMLGNQSEVNGIVEKIMAKSHSIKAGKMLTNQLLRLGSQPMASTSPKQNSASASTSSSNRSSSTTTTTSSSSRSNATASTSTASKSSRTSTSKSKSSENASSKDKKKSTRPEPTEIDMGNGTVVLETPVKEGAAERGKFLDENNCPDLVIKDIKVIKENKFHIAIEYTVKNQGTGTADLHSQKKGKDSNNMFLKAYLSSTPKFSRSAKTIGEVEVRKEMENKDGTLPRTREFTGRMYMNVRGRTNLTPYLILTLDPYQTVRECNERNNRSYVKIAVPKQ